jgi:hypothetical protein
MLPDVISDPAIQAAKEMGCQYMETFFFRAALEAGFGLKSEDEARKLMIIWARRSFQDLPLWVKNYARMRSHLKVLVFSEKPIPERR